MMTCSSVSQIQWFVTDSVSLISPRIIRLIETDNLCVLICLTTCPLEDKIQQKIQCWKQQTMDT